MSHIPLMPFSDWINIEIENSKTELSMTLACCGFEALLFTALELPPFD